MTFSLVDLRTLRGPAYLCSLSLHDLSLLSYYLHGLFQLDGLIYVRRDHGCLLCEI